MTLSSKIRTVGRISEKLGLLSLSKIGDFASILVCFPYVTSIALAFGSAMPFAQSHQPATFKNAAAMFLAVTLVPLGTMATMYGLSAAGTWADRKLEKMQSAPIDGVSH